MQNVFTCGHPNLSKTLDGTSQNFRLMKSEYEIIHVQKYVSTYKALPYKIATHENKTQHMMNKTLL